MIDHSLAKILVTGGTGLVGSKFVEIAKNEFKIETIGRTNVDVQVDLTVENEVADAISATDAEVVVNFAGYTNVDAAQQETGNRLGEVYTINALLPMWIAKACKQLGKSFYHISTDFVFDGNKVDAPYTEEELPTPVDSWYAKSKFEGEKLIEQEFGSEGKFAITRIAYPYSGTYSRKLDFARVIIEKLKKNETYFGITDQKITPVSVDEVASALILLISNKLHGYYHVAGKYDQGYISPYDFAKNLAVIMELDSSLIKPISFLEFSKNRAAPRPQHTWLDTKKIESQGMEFVGLGEAINRFKQQYEKNKNA